MRTYILLYVFLHLFAILWRQSSEKKAGNDNDFKYPSAQQSEVKISLLDHIIVTELRFK